MLISFTTRQGRFDPLVASISSTARRSVVQRSQRIPTAKTIAVNTPKAPILKARRSCSRRHSRVNVRVNAMKIRSAVLSSSGEVDNLLQPFARGRPACKGRRSPRRSEQHPHSGVRQLQQASGVKADEGDDGDEGDGQDPVGR